MAMNMAARCLVGLGISWVCMGTQATAALPASRPTLAVPAASMVVPDNAWVKMADVPPVPLGRELEPGRGAFLCYEPVRGRLLRFGGYTPSDSNALWTFDLPARRWDNPLPEDYTWPPSTNRPGAGAWWSMGWDEKHHVVWLCGGAGVVERAHRDQITDFWRYDPATGNWLSVVSMTDSGESLRAGQPGTTGEPPAVGPPFPAGAVQSLRPGLPA